MLRSFDHQLMAGLYPYHVPNSAMVAPVESHPPTIGSLYTLYSLNRWILSWDITYNPYNYWLVVWNIWIIFPYIGNVIIPTDELIFFRGVGLNHQSDDYIPTNYLELAFHKYGDGPNYSPTNPMKKSPQDISMIFPYLHQLQ